MNKLKLRRSTLDNIRSLKRWLRSKPQRVRTLGRIVWTLTGKKNIPRRYVSDYPETGNLLADYIPVRPARKLSWWLEKELVGESDKAPQNIALYLADFTQATQDALEDFLSNFERHREEDLLGVELFFLVANRRISRNLKARLTQRGTHSLAIELVDRRNALRDILSFCSVLLVEGKSRNGQKRTAVERALACGVSVHNMTGYPLQKHVVSYSQLLIDQRIARSSVVPKFPERDFASLFNPISLPKRQNILVASHDLKFAEKIISHLLHSGHEIRVDEWHGHASHDKELSESLLEWADIIWCEWSLGNAVWYAEHKNPRQRLVVRFHAQELKTRFPAITLWNAVDSVIFVSEHIKHQAIRDFDIPADQCTVIANPVTRGVLSEGNSHEERRFQLGLVGYAPKSKGLMEALSVLERLRETDQRYHLTLRGKRPEEFTWLAERPEERAYFDAAFQQIEHNSVLSGGVTFSPFGRDMHRFYSSVGFVLSTSENESFHYTIADGATHGAVPVAFRWTGADLLYPDEWLANDASGVADKIIKTNKSLRMWQQERKRAKDYIDSRYSDELIVPELAKIISSRNAT